MSKPKAQTKTRILLAAVVGTALILAAGRLISSDYLLSLLNRAAIYAVFASGVGVLLRQNGMVSFGHAAFFGLTGYATAILLRDTGLPAEAVLLLVLGGLIVLSAILGAVIVRVPGIAFAMLTLAFGQLFYQLALQSRGLTGGADGMVISWPDRLFGLELQVLLAPANMFVISWMALLLVVLGLLLFRSSRFGMTTEAIRDNPERALFVGISPMAPKVFVFALSAVLAGFAGLISALDSGFISPESMHWSVSGEVLMMVVVGGYSYVAGPAIGAVMFIIIKDVIGDFSTHWLSLFGLTLIVVVVFTKGGLSGFLDRVLPKSWLERGMPGLPVRPEGAKSGDA